MVYLFLDTNSLIEFQPFESINWYEVCGKKDYTIVISPIVIREINKHKDNSRGKKRDRARKARKRITEIAKNTVPSRLKVVFCKDPSKTAFENPQFNKEIADDWLIFSALEYNAEIDNKLIVTNDTGIYLIAKEFGIKSVEIPEKYLAPSDPTDEEIKIKELQKRITEYEDALPHVTLSFQGGNNSLNISKIDAPNFEGRIEQYAEELRGEYPYKHKEAQNPYNLFQMPDLLHSEKDYENYNALIEPYIENEPYNMVIKNLADFLNGAVIPLCFELNNEGKTPSGFLGIRLKFSNNATILSYDNSRSTIKLRKTEKPILKSAMIPSFNINMYAPIGAYYGNPTKPDSIVIWDLDKAINTAEPFMFEAKPVIQNMPPVAFAENEFYVYLGNEQNFDIYWEVIDPKLPEIITGTLHVSIK